MELKQYLYPLRRWWWLILAATLVAGLTSLLVTLQQAPIYQARTTLMMGRAIEDPNPSANEFWLGQRLAGAYADIAQRDLVKTATMQSLGMTWLPSYRARALENSNLIELVVTDTNPQRAAVVANELARQLILQTPTSTSPDEQDRQNFVNQQLDTLESQIQQTQADIDRLQQELGNLASARQINETQNQISALQAKLNTLQNNYAGLLSNTGRGAINTLSIIEPAAPPRNPIGPARAASVLVASAIGFVLAAGAAYVLEYLDDTLKTPADFERVVGEPVLGYIGEIKQNEELKRPYVANVPRHPVAEAFRHLRANLEFASVDQPLRTLLVTSTDTDEGKTTVVTNLAVTLAHNGAKVVLMDADLRRPSIHEHLGVPNENGLSDIFRGRVIMHSALRGWGDENIAVVTGGESPPNPAELLGSKRMDEILDNLNEVADMVVIDGPPFMVTDAAILAAKVDGVLLVMRPGYTRKAAARATVEQLHMAGANIVGVVLNSIPDKLAAYYAGKLHTSSYYYGSRHYFDLDLAEPAQKGSKLRQSAGRFVRRLGDGNHSTSRRDVAPASEQSSE